MISEHTFKENVTIVLNASYETIGEINVSRECVYHPCHITWAKRPHKLWQWHLIPTRNTNNGFYFLMMQCWEYRTWGSGVLNDWMIASFLDCEQWDTIWIVTNTVRPENKNDHENDERTLYIQDIWKTLKYDFIPGMSQHVHSKQCKSTQWRAFEWLVVVLLD